LELVLGDAVVLFFISGTLWNDNRQEKIGSHDGGYMMGALIMENGC
jgi:hypothetical protein